MTSRSSNPHDSRMYLPTAAANNNNTSSSMSRTSRGGRPSGGGRPSVVSAPQFPRSSRTNRHHSHDPPNRDSFHQTMLPSYSYRAAPSVDSSVPPPAPVDIIAAVREGGKHATVMILPKTKLKLLKYQKSEGKKGIFFVFCMILHQNQIN